MNLFTKEQETHRPRKHSYGYQRGKQGRVHQKFEINMYTLLYVKQIANKDLLYSIGNYTEYFVINYKRTEY